jgi:hypothetical protein
MRSRLAPAEVSWTNPDQSKGPTSPKDLQANPAQICLSQIHQPPGSAVLSHQVLAFAHALFL